MTATRVAYHMYAVFRRPMSLSEMKALVRLVISCLDRTVASCSRNHADVGRRIPYARCTEGGRRARKLKTSSRKHLL